jgi:hypothetical protein
MADDAPRTHDKYGRAIVRDPATGPPGRLLALRLYLICAALRAGREHCLLPKTRRPDGTWRDGTKVKPDYMPQDEVVTFATKGSQVRSPCRINQQCPSHRPPSLGDAAAAHGPTRADDLR